MKKTTQTLTQKQINKLDARRNKLAQYINKYPYIAAVGRVQDWLEDSTYRYPISCTILKVKDSMEGEDGIEFAWSYVSKCLRYAAGVVVDLSDIRPSGSRVGNGGESAGAALFAKIFSSINEVLRRGGVYKNGAVVLNLELGHPDAEQFMDMSASEIPWVKKTLYVSDDPSHPSYLMTSPLLEKVIQNVGNGTLWLSKITYDNKDNRVYSNVCNGILLPSRGSCLLTHVNLGLCTPRTLVPAFKRSMRALCELHKITGAGRDNYYLSPKEDKQVGLGVIGLANLLAKYKIPYIEFVCALEEYLEMSKGNKNMEDLFNLHSKKVRFLVVQLYRAFQESAKIARRYKMERAFTVEPTATSSFKNFDSLGYTTTPEISPPICHKETKSTTRDSATFGQKEYFYPKNVETAEQVGWSTYYRLCVAWQNLMETTGLAHTISFNIWNTCPVDKNFLKEWLESPLRTTYYRMMVEQDYVDKSSITSTLSEKSAALLMDKDFFTPVEDDYDAGASTSDFCFISPTDDPQYCSACAG